MRLVDGNIQYREMSVKCDVKVSVLDNEATHLDVVQIIPCYCAVCGPTTALVTGWTTTNVIKLHHSDLSPVMNKRRTSFLLISSIMFVFIKTKSFFLLLHSHSLGHSNPH